ncbi:MAG: hypothetical protein PHI08_07760 [Bacteroidales bacterium]|nr:hypothetical protein [Bacteroidales bacterium]
MKNKMSSVMAGKRKTILAVFVLVLFLVLGGFYFKSYLFPDVAKSADAHFKDCKILAKNCLDVTECGLNVYCGDGDYADCRIYDCNGSYGIFTKDISGNIDYKNKDKPDESATEAIRDNCSGTIQVVSSECIDKKTQMKVKLNTKGACEIESFATIFEGVGTIGNEFASLGDNTYSIVSDTCGNMIKIVPAAKSGIGLDMERVGA